ncbi:MAG: glutaminyl-peptide cyclotransferase [Pontibacterium sp.]
MSKLLNRLLIALFAINATSMEASASDAFEVLDEVAFDANCFTQGLVMHGTTLYASCGKYKHSKITNLNNHYSFPLMPNQFAEGIASDNTSIWQLTWKSGVLYRYDFNLKPKAQFYFKGEGWGLTYINGSDDTPPYFIRSDGSDRLWHHSATSFAPIKYLRATINGKPLDAINALGNAWGLIWANRWYDDQVYAINPSNGKVVMQMDLSSLAAPFLSKDKHNILNGIAYDSVRDGLWVTGKHWSKRFLIRPKVVRKD